jgi:hypothetical protein
VTYPPGIALNEFLPNPKTRYDHEWIELANDGNASADLAGWSIDDAVGGSPFRLPDRSVVAAHGLLLVQLPKSMLNNGGDTVRLLRPDGTTADEFSYDKIESDASFCRMDAGWTTCQATPGEPNQPPAAGQGETQLSASAALPSTGKPAPTTALAPSATATPRTPAYPAPVTAAGTTTPAALATGIPPEDGSGTVPYALAKRGTLYRGIAASSLTPTATSAATAQSLPDVVVAQSGGTPARLLGIGIGLGLLLFGGVAAGYDRLRARSLSRSDPETPASLEEEAS